tara:strand:- start:422 stop:736 length:315 start_codon:yes stop_codon:yes gene_type:complete
MARGQYYQPPSGSQINTFNDGLYTYGKYHSAITFTGGQLDLTGSNIGYSAFIRSGSTQEGNLTVIGGSTIALESFSEKTFYEIGVSQVSGSLGHGAVFLFKGSK